VFQLLDKIVLDAVASRTVTSEGYLDVRARISRTGIQEYYALELGDLFRDRDPFDIINVYRPAEEVFAQKAMDSFSKKPVTIDHPWAGVTASNHKELAVGFAGEKMERDGQFMAGSLRLTDSDAVNRVQRGEGELSAGYTCDITRESGNFGGTNYDAVQRNIIGNHIALVDAGRCGPLCKVGDRAPQLMLDKASTNDCGCKETATMNANNPAVQLQAKSYDGKSFQVDAAGAILFDLQGEKLASVTKDRDALQGKIDAMTTTHADAIKDLRTQLDAAKALQMDATKLDAAVAARTALIGDAKKILGDTFDFKGKSDADIRKEAVLKKMGDKAKDKNDGYYENAFDVLVAQAADGNTNDTGGDNMRQVFQNNQGNGNGGTYDSKSIEAARAAADKKRQDAWKN